MSGSWIRFAIALAALTSATPAIAELPAAIATMSEAAFAECRSAGGTPRLLPEYSRTADLNADGVADYLIDFAGLECANAWSYFCGSAGCPVSVWISGPNGFATEWSGYAQAIDLKAPEVVVYLHGQFCTPPRAGADGCEERLRFDNVAVAQQPATTADPAASPALGTAPSPVAWELRRPSGAAPVAVVGGPGNLRSMAAFCLAGQPWLALVFNTAPVQDRVQLILGFAAGPVTGPAERQPTTGGAFVIGLAGHDLAARLAGRDSRMTLTVNGEDYGAVSLKGSTTALQGALSDCLRP